MLRVATRIAKFFNHESCGQCTPCREGTNWMELILHKLELGRGTRRELDLLANICDRIQGNSLCALGDAAVGPVKSLVETYRDEIEQHVRERRCPFPEIRVFGNEPVH
jgi:NADH-quinone oxidoreductase subunit F